MSPSEILAAVPTLHFDGEALRWSGKIPAAVASAIQAQREAVVALCYERQEREAIRGDGVPDEQVAP
jgi:hypothetical protein